MDSDDLAHKDRINIQVSFLEKNKEIFLVGTNYIVFDDKGRYQKVRPPSKSKALHLALEKTNIFNHSSIMFRKEPKITYREKFYFGQDYDLYLSLITMKKKLACIPKFLVKHRLNPRGISCSYKLQQKQFRKKAKLFYFQRCSLGYDHYASFNPKEIHKKIKLLSNRKFS